jgi:hypothetical protein
LFFLIQFYYKRQARYTCQPFDDHALLKSTNAIMSKPNELNKHILNWLHRLLLLDSFYFKTI